MEIEIRADSVRISGYVNAVGRDSRPIVSATGEKFVEMVEPGSFARSLEKRSNVELRINHNRIIASTQDGSLKLHEDTIGLRADAVITDPAAIAKARAGKFRGWSFGMYTTDASSTMEQRANDIPRRHLHTFDMYEVTLVDDEAIPCYAGTSVEYRSDSEVVSEIRSSENEQVTVTEISPPDLSEFKKRACEIALRPFEERAIELRYNPYHDPTNGRFTSSDGGGMGVLFVGRGEKGKGAFVVDSKLFTPQIKPTAAQQQKINNIKKTLEKDKDIIEPVSFSQKKDGTIEYKYKVAREYVHEHGGKMTTPEKADIYKRITTKTGSININGLIKHYKDDKIEVLVKKGRHPQKNKSHTTQ